MARFPFVAENMTRVSVNPGVAARNRGVWVDDGIEKYIMSTWQRHVFGGS